MKMKSRGLKEEVEGQVSRSCTTLINPPPPSRPAPHQRPSAPICDAYPPHLSSILNKELRIQNLLISYDDIPLWDNIHQITAASCENNDNNNYDTSLDQYVIFGVRNLRGGGQEDMLYNYFLFPIYWHWIIQ